MAIVLNRECKKTLLFYQKMHWKPKLRSRRSLLLCIHFPPSLRSLPSPVNWVFRPQSACQADWWKKLAGKYLPPCATGSRRRRRRRRWMSGSSCWCTPTNTLPLIIFIIYMPGAVWCSVTDYHNNDEAWWMATRRKACAIIGMRLRRAHARFKRGVAPSCRIPNYRRDMISGADTSTLRPGFKSPRVNTGGRGSALNLCTTSCSSEALSLPTNSVTRKLFFPHQQPRMWWQARTRNSWNTKKQQRLDLRSAVCLHQHVVGFAACGGEALVLLAFG